MPEYKRLIIYLITLTIILSLIFVLQIIALANTMNEAAILPEIKHYTLESLPVEIQIKRIFREDAKIALAVARAESGLRNEVVSPTNDHGYFQLHGLPLYGLDNIKKAKEMFDRRGWQPWVSFNNKRYLRFIN